jgi:hypothetical protein
MLLGVGFRRLFCVVFPLPKSSWTDDITVITGTFLAILVVPLMLAADSFAVHPFSSDSKVNQEPWKTGA